MMDSYRESLVCESDRDLLGQTGCCKDGKACDNICANLAALQECSQPLAEDEQYCSRGCCEDPPEFATTASLSTAHHLQLLADDPNDQNLDDSNSAACKTKDHGTVSCEVSKGKQDVRESGCCKVDDKSKDKCCASEFQNEADDKQKMQVQDVKGCCTTKASIAIATSETCCKDDLNKSTYSSSCDNEKLLNDRESQVFRPSKTKLSCPIRLQRALEKYQSLLQQGLCVCRSILDRNRPCCSKGDRANYMANSQNKCQTVTGEPDSCCEGTNAQRKLSTSQNVPDPVGAIDTKICSNTRLSIEQKCRSQNDRSCEENGSCEIENLCEKTRPLEKKNSCGRSCTIPSNEGIVNSKVKHDFPSATKETDLEKGTNSKHVVVSIQGMTCTSCARTITNTLSRQPGISDVNINFVTAKGEFRLAQGFTTVPDLIAQLKHETGFEFARLETDLQTLDLSMTHETVNAWMEALPEGINSVEKIDKIWRVFYDPSVIGARTVFELSGARSLGPPRNDAALSDGKTKLLKMCLSFGIAAIFTVPVVVLEWSNNSVLYDTRSIIAIIFATIVQAVAVPEFYFGAIKSLIYSGVIEMDMLVAISITAAYAYSVVAFGLTHAGYVLEQGEFFETSTLLITLVILGRLVSAYAKHRAVAAVSLNSLQVGTAQLVLATGQSKEIDARLLQYGDTIIIPSHSKIVTDGEIIDGTSSVDESMHTGESVPVLKEIGDSVTAGTINGEGILTIRLTRLPGKNSITDIAGLVEAALNTKPRVQNLADKIAGYFIPVVVLIALVVFAIWLAVDIEIRGMPGGGAVGAAITYSIAVLAVSCPCALGLAVPMVLVIAGGLGARRGVIIKRADATEKSYKVTDVVFDKTGTLTYGELQVQESITIGTIFSDAEVTDLTYGLVKDNKHPVSVAVAKFINVQSERKEALDSLQSIPGKGLQASWRGKSVCAGNPYWLEISEHPQITSRIQAGETLFCITVDSSLVAIYSLKTTIRTEALDVVRELQARGIMCHIVSGDGPLVVADVVKSLNIAPENAMSRHSPAEKQAYVQKLMNDGKYVLFCGDGTNDAVAVAQAHVGLQIGNTSDVTKATSDVVLLGGLDGIVKLLDISKAAYRRIVFSFAWSAVYNIFAILLAAGAFVTVRIPPAFAGLGEIVSVLPVVLAALTLLW